MALVASSVIFAQTGDDRIDNGLPAAIELAKVIGDTSKECDSIPRNGGASYRSHVFCFERKKAVSRADVYARNVDKDRKAF